MRCWRGWEGNGRTAREDVPAWASARVGGYLAGPRRAEPTRDFAANTVEVEGPLTRDPGARRFYTSSSCGVCGKGALEELAVSSAPAPHRPAAARSLLARLPERLEQPGFGRTGALHPSRPFSRAASPAPAP